jgi:hypothetical protein
MLIVCDYEGDRMWGVTGSDSVEQSGLVIK